MKKDPIWVIGIFVLVVMGLVLVLFFFHDDSLAGQATRSASSITKVPSKLTQTFQPVKLDLSKYRYISFRKQEEPVFNITNVKYNFSDNPSVAKTDNTKIKEGLEAGLQIEKQYHGVALPSNKIAYFGDGIYPIGVGTNITLSNGVKVVVRNAYVAKRDIPDEHGIQWGYGLYLVYDYYLGNEKLNYLPFTTYFGVNSYNSNHVYGTKITFVEKKINQSRLYNVSFVSNFNVSSCRDIYEKCLLINPELKYHCRDMYCPRMPLEGESSLKIGNITYVYDLSQSYDIPALDKKIVACSNLVKEKYQINSAPDEFVVRVNPESGPFVISQFGFKTSQDFKSASDECIHLLAHEMTHRYTLQMGAGVGRLSEGLATYTENHYFDLSGDKVICGGLGWTLNNSNFQSQFGKGVCEQKFLSQCGKSVSGTHWVYNQSYSLAYNSGNAWEESNLFNVIKTGNVETHYRWKIETVNYPESMNVSIYSQELKSGSWGVEKLVRNFLVKKGEVYNDPSGLTLIVVNYPQGIVLFPYFNVNQSCYNQNNCQKYVNLPEGYVPYFNYSDTSSNGYDDYDSFYKSGACFWEDVGEQNVIKYLKLQDDLLKNNGGIFYPYYKLKQIVGENKFNQLVNKYGLYFGDVSGYVNEPWNDNDNFDKVVGLVS